MIKQGQGNRILQGMVATKLQKKGGGRYDNIRINNLSVGVFNVCNISNLSDY